MNLNVSKSHGYVSMINEHISQTNCLSDAYCDVLALIETDNQIYRHTNLQTDKQDKPLKTKTVLYSVL